jgi:hypothetical protein
MNIVAVSGQPVGPPLSPPGPGPPGPPIPGPPPWGYPYPRPKPDHTVLIVVIVVVIVILVPTVLAAVLYVMVSGLITPHPGLQKPLVSFTGVTKVNALTWTFSVASAQPSVGPSNYQLNFGIGTKIGAAVPMGTSNVNSTVTVTGAIPASVSIKWTDLGGTGRVKGGDIFTIQFPSAPSSGTLLTFYLVYSDGSLIQSSTWQG